LQLSKKWTARSCLQRTNIIPHIFLRTRFCPVAAPQILTSSSTVQILEKSFDIDIGEISAGCLGTVAVPGKPSQDNDH
jgi:hypothetical protein